MKEKNNYAEFIEHDLIPYREEDYTPNFVLYEDHETNLKGLEQSNEMATSVDESIPYKNHKNKAQLEIYKSQTENKDKSQMELSNKVERKVRKKPRFLLLKAIGVSLIVVLAAFALGSGLGAGYSLISEIIASNNNFLENDTYGDSLLAVSTSPEAMAMVSAVDRVRPAVVSINTVIPVNADRQVGFFFSPFFDLPEEERPSSGTGIIFYEDGQNVYILTNEHVISGATSIEISFGRDRVVSATIKGRDVGSDLAVLYIPWSSLQEIDIDQVVTAEFGDSNDMQIGEFVMAIGNALGQGITTTQGVVSAQNIELIIDNRALSVIQTDAAINPGNSGGPLINGRGQVIGINTVKISRPAVYGMGFAVTSNVAIPVIDSIMQGTAQPVLGISGSSMSGLQPQYRYNLGSETGVFINGVQPNSGADRAGLGRYDVITHFDGQSVSDMIALREFIAEQNLGDTIILGIIRNGEFIEVEVTFVQF